MPTDEARQALEELFNFEVMQAKEHSGRSAAPERVAIDAFLNRAELVGYASINYSDWYACRDHIYQLYPKMLSGDKLLAQIHAHSSSPDDDSTPHIS